MIKGGGGINMFIRDRDDARRFFTEVWRKYHETAGLEPVEQLVLGVILEHPEYHQYLENEEVALNLEVNPDFGETNPFLHMGMHIAIKEQVQSDRPPGIRQLYHNLCGRRIQDRHEVEHKMMECLGGIMWKSQRAGRLPDENEYLECIKKID